MPVYILAHDIGTSGNKASVFDENGRLIASAGVGYPTETPGLGWMEQSAEDWYRAVCEATRQVLSGLDASCVRAIGVSGQMMAALPVGSDGRPLRPAIMWSDCRASQEAELLREQLGEHDFYRITGQPLSPNYPIAKILWLKQNRPEIYRSAACFLQAKDYINLRLTGGGYFTDPTDAAYTCLYDITAGAWSKTLCDLADIDMQKLPQVVPCGTVIGHVCEQAARECGIPSGIPVVETAGDGSAAHLGAGNAQAGDGYICLGSSTWIVAATPQLCFDEDSRMQSEPHVVQDLSVYLGTMQAGGLSYDWCRQLLGGRFSFEEMDALAGQTPPGSRGTVFLPYIAGERSPWYDHRLNASFLGLRQDCAAGELIRSVMEGVAFNLALILDTIRKDAQVDTLTLIGGGARSRVWQQILADILETPILVAENVHEGTSLGAAMIAGVGAGVFPDFSVCRRFIRSSRTVRPDERTFVVYRREKEIFRDACHAMRALNARIYALKGDLLP